MNEKASAQNCVQNGLFNGLFLEIERADGDQAEQNAQQNETISIDHNVRVELDWLVSIGTRPVGQLHWATELDFLLVGRVELFDDADSESIQ